MPAPPTAPAPVASTAPTEPAVGPAPSYPYPADQALVPGYSLSYGAPTSFDPVWQGVAPYVGQAPPAPPKPAKSTLAAVLLNLTGLGLGYAYLRHRILFGVALAVVAGLVVVAFATGAAEQPWLWRGLAAGWILLLVLHASLIARRRPAPPSTWRPVTVGTVSVAVVVAGYVGYGIAGGSVHDDGVAAQTRADCPAAIDRFDTVTGPFELTLSTDVPDAAARRAECAQYLEGVDAQRRDQHAVAIHQYRQFGADHPKSVLAPFARTNLAESYVDLATGWQAPLTAQTARETVDTLLMVTREFGDTPAAKRVPKGIADAFAAAAEPYTAGKFCDSLLSLEYFAGLDRASVGEVVDTANTYRAQALYECGLIQARAGDAAATATLDTYLTAYPQHPGFAQAKAAQISATVAKAAGVTLAVPPPLGDNNPGSIPVEFYNDSNTPLTLQVAGPTAHEFTLPPCAICPADYPENAGCGDLTGRPSITLRLTAAPYYYTTVRDDDVNSLVSSVTPMPGYIHTQCVYVVRP